MFSQNMIFFSFSLKLYRKPFFLFTSS